MLSKWLVSTFANAVFLCSLVDAAGKVIVDPTSCATEGQVDAVEQAVKDAISMADTAKTLLSAASADQIIDARDKGGLFAALFDPPNDRSRVTQVFSNIAGFRNPFLNPTDITIYCNENHIRFPNQNQATDATSMFMDTGFKDKSGNALNVDIGQSSGSQPLPRQKFCKSGNIYAYTIHGTGGEQKKA
jgi:hypothetical protein